MNQKMVKIFFNLIDIFVYLYKCKNKIILKIKFMLNIK